jgi:UrcA family protein
MPRYMIPKTLIPCTLLVMSLGPLSSVAVAIEQDEAPPARTVDFADLNLSSSAGAAVLYARIKSAAAQVVSLSVLAELVDPRAARRSE